MKVLVMITGSGADEEAIAPTEQMFAEMNVYNQQLAEAGIMIGGEGLLPSRQGAKVVFEGGTTTVVDGPFTEAKEIVAGYWIWEVRSLEEAVEWAKRCPNGVEGVSSSLQIRQIATVEDFGDAYTPEVAAQEEQVAETIREKHGA
jgi:hypothetical protein